MKRFVWAMMIVLFAASVVWGAKIEFQHTTGSTIYAIIRDSSDATVWNGSAFEAWNSANIATYDVALSGGADSSMYYSVTFPAGITAGTYTVAIHLQAGGSPATSDTLLGAGEMASDGIPKVDVTAINAVSAASVTTVNANLGTTQAVPFTSIGGTQTPQATLTGYIGTAVTEAGGAGRLAAAVSTWGNVATPATTAASVNQTGDSYARLGAPAGASIAADIAAGTTAARLKTGTVATAGTASTFTLSSGFPAIANAYLRGAILTFTDATTGQIYAGIIRSYTSGRVVTMQNPLPAAPELGDAVSVWPFLFVPAGF